MCFEFVGWLYNTFMREEKFLHGWRHTEGEFPSCSEHVKSHHCLYGQSHVHWRVVHVEALSHPLHMMEGTVEPWNMCEIQTHWNAGWRCVCMHGYQWMDFHCIVNVWPTHDVCCWRISVKPVGYAKGCWLCFLWRIWACDWGRPGTQQGGDL